MSTAQVVVSPCNVDVRSVEQFPDSLTQGILGYHKNWPQSRSSYAWDGQHLTEEDNDGSEIDVGSIRYSKDPCIGMLTKDNRQASSHLKRSGNN